MRTAVLLCEGPCNRTFASVMRAIESEHAVGGDIPPDLITAHRALVYTEHRWAPALARPENYVCVECHKARRYGYDRPQRREPIPMLG